MIQRPLAVLFLAVSSALSIASTFDTAALAAPSAVALEKQETLKSTEQYPYESKDCPADREKLEKGEVIVGMKTVGSQKFVTGKIIINESPDKVWPIMVNPFEFQGKISPRVKKVEVMTDEADLSIMRMTMDTSPLPFMPTLNYTVESRYEQTDRGGHIEFKRVAGTLKDFRGFWDMAPADGGKKTELTYSMYLDPGFFVPQWIVREGVKGELPRTLTALRLRVNDVYECEKSLEHKTIVAAAVHHQHVRLY